jgi:hypothetical protein
MRFLLAAKISTPLYPACLESQVKGKAACDDLKIYIYFPGGGFSMSTRTATADQESMCQKDERVSPKHC